MASSNKIRLPRGFKLLKVLEDKLTYGMNCEVSLRLVLKYNDKKFRIIFYDRTCEHTHELNVYKDDGWKFIANNLDINAFMSCKNVEWDMHPYECNMEYFDMWRYDFVQACCKYLKMLYEE